MNVTSDLISVLTSKQQRGFISYLKTRNKRHSTRNVELFLKLLNNRQHTLKNELGANAYGALKKRLTDNLLDYLSATSIKNEVTEEIAIIKLLVVARKLLSHQKVKTAFKLLRDAECQAEQINHYSLLNEVYHTIIENSAHLTNNEHEHIIKKFEFNQKELNEQGKLTLVHSIVRKAYLNTERGQSTIDLKSLLIKSYKRFNISEERGYNFRSLFQIAELADFTGASSKDYFSVDTFFENKIEQISGTPLDSEKHLVYHIDLLYLLANIYFRKQNFAKSLSLLEKMHTQMQRSEGRFYSEKEPKYKTLKALNYNYLGDYKQALNILDDLVSSQKSMEELLNPWMCKLMIHFLQEDLKEVKVILSRFTRTDQWYEKHIGMEWLLFKNFSEILLHVELRNTNYLDSRLSSFKRKLKNTTILESHPRVKTFLKWIDLYIKNPSIVKSDKFRLEVETSISWKPREQEDIFMITCYAWLKSKMEDKNIYDAILEILSIPCL